MGETTAVTLARGYGSAAAFLKAMDELVLEASDAMEELDAMDQVGGSVVQAAAPTSPRTTTARGWRRWWSN